MLKRLLILAALSAVGMLATDTRLVDAVKNHDKDAVRALVKEHVDVNVPEADGTSALHWAAHSNDLETVQLLIRAGANAKAVSRYGVTPLSAAATYGGAAVVESLVKPGADAHTHTILRGEPALAT